MKNVRLQSFGHPAMIAEPPKKAQGVQYSALAIFKDPQEAHQAFENLNGRLEKDKNGLEQKTITFKLNAGTTASIHVRKMAHDHSLHQGLLKKRAFQGENLVDPKKLKTDDCDNHLKEMERLKQELKEKDLDQCNNHLKEIERLKKDLSAKDFQISAQDKIISKLKKDLEEMKHKKKR
ncbi:hypothetical protein MANES_12G151175v8 [Manihot esculenta]|uniref:Uncharacterized protein n=1 Tax=Manihot esculenta TaxID=3983 RepID=A0ACB7GSL7_MANES|nr:hypothetical protein MANES_12G151175v8 [Manihot esculenta]